MDIYNNKSKIKSKHINRKLKLGRFLFITCVLTVLFMGLMGRLIFLMAFKAEDLESKANVQWNREMKINPKRGSILDRQGREIAVSIDVYRVDVDLVSLRKKLKNNDYTMEDVTDKLGEILDMDGKDLYKKFNTKLDNGEFIRNAIVKRQVSKEQVDAINAMSKEMNIWGFVISPDTKRYYVNNNFLAQELGQVNIDGQGLSGIELMYNKYLSGIPGLQYFEKDAEGEALTNTPVEYVEPVDGRDVVLTIDETIQKYAEEAAEKALIDNKAKTVSIIVSNPKNGEILAMVNKPDFNPNNPWDDSKTLEENQKLWRNRAVSDTFEPGSIFKVITAAAALSEKAITEDEIFYCPGYIIVQNTVVHCNNGIAHGYQNISQLLQNSCNVGFVQVGQKLGAAKLNKYIDLFGFGHKTGIDLNGESSGIIKPTDKVTLLDLATISFGQTNTMSLIQYITAFNAVANGGTLITPHLMKEIVHTNDKNKIVIDKEYESYNKRKVLDSEVAKKVRGYLEKEVSIGGGHNAYIPGYRIGGKTATAQKIDPVNGGYAKGKYIGSFTAMAPVDDPQLTIIVSVDEPDPSKYYGGEVAAPVAKEVLDNAFKYLAVNPYAISKEPVKPLIKQVEVPKIREWYVKDAIKVLEKNNFKYEVVSDGPYVVDVSPEPGTMVPEGEKITIYTKPR